MAPLVVVVAVLAVLAAPSLASAEPLEIRYSVSTAGHVAGDPDEFGRIVDAVLADPRGWTLGGSVLFKRVPSGGRFTVTLAEPSIVDAHGGCTAVYSCTSGRLVLVNDDRWRLGTRSY